MRKHLACKHETFAYDLLLQDSEPYMKVRYESEDIGSRPLPPIEVRERERGRGKRGKREIERERERERE